MNHLIRFNLPLWKLEKQLVHPRSRGSLALAVCSPASTKANVRAVLVQVIEAAASQFIRNTIKLL